MVLQEQLLMFLCWHAMVITHVSMTQPCFRHPTAEPEGDLTTSDCRSD